MNEIWKSIKVNNKNIYLGSFTDKKLALESYQNKLNTL